MRHHWAQAYSQTVLLSVRKIVWERKRDCMCLFSCVCMCVCLHLYSVSMYSTVWMWLGRGGEESLLLFCSDVSLLLWGALHTRHLHVALQLREGQTQVQSLDGDQCAPFKRSCNWAHLHRKKVIVRWRKDLMYSDRLPDISLWVLSTPI